MFDKPFDQLFRALQRIEDQLAAADTEQKQILREELLALRTVCDRFVEKWLVFEEKISEMSEEFSLDLEMVPASQTMNCQTAAGQTVAKQGVKPSIPVWAGVPSIHPVTEERIVRSFRKGMGFFELFMYPDAIRELEQVLELDSSFAVARLYLALGYLGAGQLSKAAEHLDVVASSTPDPFITAIVHNSFGQILAGQGRYQEAVEEFLQAAAYSESFRDVHFNLGVCQYNLQMYEEAAASFMTALEQEPDDWEAELVMSYVWNRLGFPTKALQRIRRSYQYNSSNYEVIMQFADVCQELGHNDAARSLYARAARLHPHKTGPLSGAGWMSLKQGRMRQAVNHFKRQLSLEPHNRQAQFNLGWALFQSGEHAKAEQIFSGLISGQTEFLPARIGMACLLLDKGDYKQAVSVINQALQAEPNSRDLWFYKGMAHAGLGQNDEAELCWNHCQ